MMISRKSSLSVGLAAFGLVLFTSCAHQSSHAPTSSSTPEASKTVVDPDAPRVTLREIESFRVSDPDGPKVVDEELEQIPTDINPLVEKWIAYFQGKGRVHMERYLSRSTRYSKLMKKILRQNGLPEDLIYIALIESGFTYKATSHAAAVGYWQFIKGTGKRYGLEINSLVDERRDPVLSTQAAAEYFKGLYSVFGSWYLAMASYNVGENRVKREVMDNYTRDFWELARKRRFPKETSNYIPKFIAAKLIANSPTKYGFTEIEYMTPIEFDHIKVDKPVNLHAMADKMNLDYDDLKQLNPKFKGEVAPLKGNSLEIRVPIGQTELALNAARESFVERVEYIADAGDTQVYKIRSGDSLHTIARKYRTTVAWLRDVNDLQKGRKLRVGQRIAVPDRSGKKPVAVKLVAKADKSEKPIEKLDKSEDAETATPVPELVTQKGVFYIVQPGDTLSAIADDYNSSIEELRRMNKMSRGTILKAGMKLRVPKDDGLPADPNEDRKLAADKEKDKEESSEQTSAAAAKTAQADAKPADSKVEEPVRTSAEREPQTAAAEASAHVVRPGENLTTIARKYGVTIQALRKANGLSKRSVLKIGSRILIPENRPQTLRNNRSQNAPQLAAPQPREISMRKAHRPRVHIVRRGENLTQIAEKYQVPLQTLREENRIHGGSKLFVGTKLLIPVAQASLR